MTLRWDYHALVGLHGPADPGDWPWRIDSEAAFALVKTAKIEAVKLLSSADIGSSVVERLRADGVKWLYARIFNVFNQRMAPEQYIGEVEDAIQRLYAAGITHFELTNEPNLGNNDYREGMWVQWQDGREFAEWWLIGYAYLKQRYPAMQVGFPGLSPGADEPGLRYDSTRFFSEAMDAVRTADFLNLHTYWDGASSTLDQSVEAVRQFVERFPDKLVFVSEFSNGNLQTDKAVKGREYVEFYARMKQMPSNLGGAIGYVLSASSGQVEQTWKGSPIPEIVGARPVSVPAPIPTPEVPKMPDYAFGLDYSHHQNASFSWERAKNEDDVEFAICRFAYGLRRDDKFDTSLAAAKATGLPVGAYFFPVAEQNTDDQAAFFASITQWLDLPMFLDVETDRTQDTQINEAQAKRFLEETARRTGKVPGVYTSKVEWERLIGLGKTWANGYHLWVAHHNDQILYPALPDIWSNWLLWQIRVDPIKSYANDVDQNVFHGTVADLKCRFGLPSPDVFPLTWPVNSTRVTQGFGENPDHYGPLLGTKYAGHEGWDFAAALNDPIYACADGVIAERYFDQDYGNLIVLDHQNGFKTLYAHMNTLSPLTIGTRVKAGDVIGKAGTTGRSTGVHLHLGFYYDRGEGISIYPRKTRGWIINPTQYLRARVVPPVSVSMRMKYIEPINIRAEPKLASLDIGDVAVGEIVTAYPPAIGDYLKIMAHGVLGYSLGKHFEAVVEQPVRLRSIAQPYVNVRSGPATSYTDIGDLPFGETIMGFPVIGDAFYRVILRDGSYGWIASQWLEIVSS